MKKLNQIYQETQDNQILVDFYTSLRENPSPIAVLQERNFVLNILGHQTKFQITCLDYIHNFQGSNEWMQLNKVKDIKQISNLDLICKYAQDINIYSILGYEKIDVLFKLWEIIILNQSLIVISDSPSISSDLIHGIQGCIFPISYRGTSFPYMSIFDKSFEKLKGNTGSHLNNLIGVTNPLFLKHLKKIGATLRLDQLFEKELEAMLVHTSSAN